MFALFCRGYIISSYKYEEVKWMLSVKPTKINHTKHTSKRESCAWIIGFISFSPSCKLRYFANIANTNVRYQWCIKICGWHIIHILGSLANPGEYDTDDLLDVKKCPGIGPR